MPTNKRRVKIIPDNLPANINPEETMPSLFTGQKLFDTDPVKYGQVVQALATGASMTKVAKSFKLSPATVSAILKREHKAIEGTQSLVSGMTSYASQAFLERMIEKVEQDKIPPGVLPIAWGILRDKEKADQGQATQIVEHKKALTLDQVKAELDQMKREKEAEVINVSDLNNSKQTLES